MNKFNGQSFYLVLNTADLTVTILNLSDNLSADLLRKNSDGSKIILQFSGNIPAEILSFNLYSGEEIRALLLTEEWAPIAETGE